MASKFRSSIQNTIKHYPVLTNTIVYGTLYGSAELLQQGYHKYYLKDKIQFDFASAARIVAVGGCVMAPTLTYWYRYLDGRYPGTSTRAVLKKVVSDQLFMAPILVLIFFTSLSFLEGRDDLFEELRLKFKKTFLINQCFWIPASIVNFFYIQPDMRVVFVATLAFLWINVLCYIKREKVS